MTRAKYRDVILDTAGRGVAASITVRQTGTATAFSPIYDASGNVLSNPITANANGEFEFYTDEPERVDLYVAVSGFTAETVTVDTYDPDDLAELLGEADPFPQYQTEAEVSAQIAAEAPSSPVSSVFGRTGAVTAQQADYDGFFLTPAEGNAAYEAAGAVATHSADTTAVHGITDTSVLETTTGSQTKVDTHVNDTSDAHDASAISFSPTGTIAATDVQAAIAEVASEAGGSEPMVPVPVYRTAATYVLSALRFTGTFASPTQDTLYAIPFLIGVTGTFDRLGLQRANTATAAGGVIRLGIYADNGSQRPGALVRQTGAIAADTNTGTQSQYEALSPSLQLTPGLYWAAFVGQVAVVANQVGCPPTTEPSFVPVPYLGEIPASSILLAAVRKTGVTGALPDPYGTPTADMALSDRPPVLFLRGA